MLLSSSIDIIKWKSIVSETTYMKKEYDNLYDAMTNNNFLAVKFLVENEAKPEDMYIHDDIDHDIGWYLIKKGARVSSLFFEY